MKPSVIVWDLETVPDIGGFAAANDLVGKSDVEVREAIGDKFPKHIYHSIVCIGALVAHRESDHWAVDAVGAPHVGDRTEKELITAFCDKIAELKPQLVTFNGNSFDLPVLRYRAMVHGVFAPGLSARSASYVVLLSRLQLEIWAFVTPDVTPSAWQPHSAPLNIPDKLLILKMERVKGIEPSSSAWKDFALSVRLLPLVDIDLRPVHAHRRLVQNVTSWRHCRAQVFFASDDIRGPLAPLGRYDRTGSVEHHGGAEIGSAPRHCRRARKDDGGRIAFPLHHPLGPSRHCFVGLFVGRTRLFHISL
jgi:hypothetical protein